jgi:hypothetical protein
MGIDFYYNPPDSDIDIQTWYLVVDIEGNAEQVFNSKPGAEFWIEEHGGFLIEVREK